MATLTSVAYYTRKAIVYGSAGFVSLLILLVAWGAFSAWWVKNHPPPPPPPTVAFGVLPAIKFPDGKDPKQVSLKLETITGAAPDLGPQAKVYFMPSYRANVLGLELAAGLAAKLGFLFAPVRVDEQVYEWTREGTLPGTLSVNLVTGHFRLTTLWYRDAQISTARAPTEAEAVRTAKRFLSSANLLDNDLDAGAAKVEYLQAGAGVYSSAVSQSEANFAQVHLFRAGVENIPVVTPNPSEGLVQVVVSGVSSQKQIIEAVFRYSPVEYSRFATYPLRPSKTAWEILSSGQGYIPKLIPTQGQTAVRRVKIAYFDNSTPQEFFQPIYVFEGDNGFLGYVPALDPKWLGKN
ncbi:MAG: hypothetical protein UW60_C0048G0005 [Candidatus Woesebacteria bacterium GW2011_GWA2_44_33]|uniref:Uncharacterized protein n=1 Tax=Candidatus Woesebacteria bacterium GW2011_GWA2_44_33 TaxID=1618564 RepID=A0A0G1J073_9BACT|nr:MAG: hypothetical protein UW60_C0048G0005 [Candidatus Woesebacteria bacterium GW2011_GWA2_44_33]